MLQFSAWSFILNKSTSSGLNIQQIPITSPATGWPERALSMQPGLSIATVKLLREAFSLFGCFERAVFVCEAFSSHPLQTWWQVCHGKANKHILVCPDIQICVLCFVFINCEDWIFDIIDCQRGGCVLRYLPSTISSSQSKCLCWCTEPVTE